MLWFCALEVSGKDQLVTLNCICGESSCQDEDHGTESEQGCYLLVAKKAEIGMEGKVGLSMIHCLPGVPRMENNPWRQSCRDISGPTIILQGLHLYSEIIAWNSSQNKVCLF